MPTKRYILECDCQCFWCSTVFEVFEEEETYEGKDYGWLILDIRQLHQEPNFFQRLKVGIKYIFFRKSISDFGETSITVKNPLSSPSETPKLQGREKIKGLIEFLQKNILDRMG